MANEKKPVDFLKVVEGIKKTAEAERKEAFKQIREFYLELIENGFTMDEAMAFIAALTRQSNDGSKK
jgi:DNA-directed RNA polymerase delta subunit